MKQEELLKQIRTILNDLPFGEKGYRYKQIAFDACVKTAEWLQEQMMKDAVEGELDCDDNGSWCSFDSNIVSVSQAGDKVKVIIIKE